MAVIQPFKGLRYNNKKITDQGKVITPPYDVIDEAAQNNLHELSPYNVIRLEYGKIFDSDHDQDNRYTRAEESLNKWIADGILQTDQQAAFYLYEQQYNYNQGEYRRRGIIAALQVEDYGARVILPHELTMTAPKADRYELLSHLKTNISPIFTLFPDPEAQIDYYFTEVAKEKPLVEAMEDSGQVHRLWALTDNRLQDQLVDYLAPQPLLIADGHHRYETALSYARNNSSLSDAGKDYILTVMVSMKDAGLLVLPTHRLIRELTAEQNAALENVLLKNFQFDYYGVPGRMDCARYLETLSRLSAEKQAIGFLDNIRAGYLIPKDNSFAHTLPVTILQEQILKPVLAPGEKSVVDKSMLSYPHDFDSAMREVLSSRAEAAFILEPIAVEEVLKRAEAGEVMPQKSTFFYPKLPSGLVMHHHRLSY